MMRSNSDASNSTGRSVIGNAFAADFLADFKGHPEVGSAAEAELTGPWRVAAVAGGWGVFRDGEGPAVQGGDLDEPEGVFEHREHALLLAAVLTALGREPLFHLDSEKAADGYPLEAVWGDTWTRTVGRVRVYQPEIETALHLAESVVRSPAALASLLEAAGATALELAGKLLTRRLENPEP